MEVYKTLKIPVTTLTRPVTTYEAEFSTSRNGITKRLTILKIKALRKILGGSKINGN
jgi:hypothetical protein